MTTREPSHSTETMPPPEAQQDSGVHVGKIIAVALGALVVFAAGTYWSSQILKVQSRLLQPRGPDPIPSQIGQGEIGIVDQAPFDVTRTLQNYRTDRNKRLGSWGWVDRKQGIVHMPIEQAMDLVVKEGAK